METPGTDVPQSLKWYEVWREVFLRPSERTFHRILADPLAKPGRAFIWVAIVGLLSGIVQSFSAQNVDMGQAVQFNAFTLAIIMTGGGPLRATEVMGLYIYKVAFDSFDFGMASAASLVLFGMILVVTLLYLRIADPARGEGR